MKQMQFQAKYPVISTEIHKDESHCRTLIDVVAYYKARIAENPKVQFIGEFDHFAHTTRIGGEIAVEIEGAIDLIFCFGYALPSAQMLAVRPRSIGIADMGDRFVISFMEAPMPAANQAMKEWTQALRII